MEFNNWAVSFYDKRNVYYDCTVQIMNGVAYGEIFYMPTKTLIMIAPENDNEKIDGCMVEELINTETGERSYGWLRQSI